MFDSFRTWLLRGMRRRDVGRSSPFRKSAAFPRARVAIVVEGKNDARLLYRLSALLHRDDPDLPNLAHWEAEGIVVFVPFGGGDRGLWTIQLELVAAATFYLFDRETGRVTERRLDFVRGLNLRPNTVARLTSKRTLENYLHPKAIVAACGLTVDFGDDDDVAGIVARADYAQRYREVSWEKLSPRVRRRRRDRCKLWLNIDAANCMTIEMLAERDPSGEVRSWLRTIADMANLADDDHQSND